MKRFTTLLATLVLMLGLAAPALAQIHTSVSVLDGSCGSPSYTFFNDTDTGLFRVSSGTIGICANGARVGTIDANGVSSTTTTMAISAANGTISTSTTSQTGTGNVQAVAGDLNISGTPGHIGGYLAGEMGNVISAGITGTGNSNVAGVVGTYSVLAANSSTHAKAGVMGEVAGNTVSADGAFVAVLAEGVTTARAAYTVDFQNSSGPTTAYFNYGVDLQGPGAHNGYVAPTFKDGFLRLGGTFRNAGVNEAVADVCVLVGTSVPTNGASGSGAGNCDSGSLYIRTSGANGKVWINTNTKASPTWTIVGTQS